MGQYVAAIIHEEQGRPARHSGRVRARARGFHYKDFGSMATVGKSRAVVEIGPFRFGGLLAWFAWLALHITVLIGFRNRISVFVSWIYGYVFFRRGSRLITRSYDKSGRAVPETLKSPPLRAQIRRAMAERAHASHIPPGRYSKRLGDGASGGAASASGAPATAAQQLRARPHLQFQRSQLPRCLQVQPACARAGLEHEQVPRRRHWASHALQRARCRPALRMSGSLIVDAVVAAIRAGGVEPTRVIELVGARRRYSSPASLRLSAGLSLCQWLLRAQLGQRVNVMILEKAFTLDLRHFEDSEFYDKLTRARREASSRPLSLVMRTFGLVQNGISLISFGTLLAHFSPWAVAILLLAGLPAFIAEAVLR